MSEMQIGCRRVKPGLYSKRSAQRKARAKVLFTDALGKSLLQIRKLLFNRGQTPILFVPKSFRRIQAGGSTGGKQSNNEANYGRNGKRNHD